MESGLTNSPALIGTGAAKGGTSPVSGGDRGPLRQKCSQLEVIQQLGHAVLHGRVGDGLRELAGQGSFIPTRVVNSPLPTSWAGCRQRTSRSAGLAEGGATATSWWKGFGEWLSTRRFIYVPTAMAGTRKLAWLDSYGGITMLDPTVTWGAKLPMRSIVVLKPVPPVLG